MVRPCKCRRICANPTATVYKPRGIPAHMLEMIELQMDELEALRLADLKGIYHAEAAREMNVSRPTFGRILNRAHAKVAEALLEGKGLVLGGGPIHHITSTACPVRAREPKE